MTTSTKPRVVIVGTGFIAGVHARAARGAGAEIVGVLGSAPEKGRAFADEYDIQRSFDGIADALRDDIDVVQICTPNATHFDFAVAALRAGKHVVCEKPLATSVSDAQKIADLASRSGLTAAVPFVYRYHPLVQELRSRVMDGRLGDILSIHGSYLQDWMLNRASSNWRVSAPEGGASRAFADIGSHWCDLAEFITGQKFDRVVSRTQIAYPTRPVPKAASFSAPPADGTVETVEVTTEDSAAAIFSTNSGVLANVVVSQVAAGRKNRLWLEIDGSQGSGVFDQEQPESIWLGREDAATVVRRGEGQQATGQARMNFLPAGHPQGYADAFTSFLRDVYSSTNGCAVEGLPTFADGLRSTKLVQAVLASHESGSWTAI